MLVRSVRQVRKSRWEEDYERVTTLPSAGKLQQPNVLRAVNEAAGPSSVVIGAAGSLPGDPPKLWKNSEPGGYHLAYGSSSVASHMAVAIAVDMASAYMAVVV